MTHPLSTFASLQDAKFLAVDVRSMLEHRQRSLLWCVGLGLAPLERLHLDLAARLLQLTQCLHDAPEDVTDGFADLIDHTLALLGSDPGDPDESTHRGILWGPSAWLRAGRHQRAAHDAATLLESRITHHLSRLEGSEGALIREGLHQSTGPARNRARNRRHSGARVIAAG